jgi:hypothetical protein
MERRDRADYRFVNASEELRMNDRARVATAAATGPAATGPRYWIAVISQQSADAAVTGGYLEVGYGKAGPLERMAPGDGVLVYSPRERDEQGAPVQAFTALGRVGDGAMYQLPRDHQPFRRTVEWLSATPALVRPLLDALSFIRNKTHWGSAFRFGFLRVPPADFARIAAAMQVDWPGPPPAPAAVAAEPADRAPREGVAA